MTVSVLAVKNEITKFDKQAKAAFFGMYEQKRKGILDKLKPVMMEVPSDGPEEKYPFMDATPQVVDYEEGNVPVSELGAETQTIVNKLSGRAIAVNRTYFEDIGRMNGARQLLLQRVEGLAMRALNYKVKLFFDALTAANRFSSATCWDGKALYSTTHQGGTNKATGNQAVNMAQLLTEHDLVLKTFGAQQDPTNEDKLREEQPNELLVIVPANVVTRYAQFFKASVSISVDGVAAAVTNVLAEANSGVFRGIDGLGNRVTLIGWTRLNQAAASRKVYYFDISGELPGPPPILDQIRIPATLEFLGTGSDQYVIAEQLFWKVRQRGNLGYADFQKTVEVDKTAGS